MADQYGFSYGQAAKDAESILSSRYGRAQAKKRDKRADEEYAYGLGKRKKADTRATEIQGFKENFGNDESMQLFKAKYPEDFQRVQSIYDSGDDRAKEQERSQLMQTGKDLGYVINAPQGQEQSRWDQVRAIQSPEVQEQMGDAYNPDFIEFTRERTSLAAKAMSFAENLNERKFAYQQKRDTIEDKQKKAASESKKGAGREFKTTDATTIDKLIAKDYDTGIVELANGEKIYKFANEADKTEANAIRAIADEIYHKGGVSHIKAIGMAKKEFRKGKKPLTLEEAMNKYK